MKVPVIGLLRYCIRPVYCVFGRGLGRIKVVQTVFRWAISWAVPKQFVFVGTNGYKLGMTVGGDRGFDEESVSLLFGAGYEPQMTKLFKSVVKPSMNVVDIGAHIGYYTVLASKLNSGKVWAFEPDPNNYDELVRNIKFNGCGNVTAVSKAVGSRTESAELFLYGRFSGERSLVDIGHQLHKTVGVDVVSLDEFLGKGKIDVVKIDVDGGEVGVLTGMKHLLERNPQVKIFTEVWKRGLEDAGYSCIEYWDLLIQHGFWHIYLIDDRKNTAEETNLGGLLRYVGKFGGVNLFCSREGIANPSSL